MPGCKLCVAVLCGLPASGKSSVAHILASSGAGVPSDRHSEKQDSTNSGQGTSATTSEDHVRFIIVEYDKLLPADVEKQLIEEEAGKQLIKEEAGKQLIAEEAGKHLVEEEAGKQLIGVEAGKQLIEEEAGKQLIEEEARKQLIEEDAGKQLIAEDAGKQLIEEDAGKQLIEEEAGKQLIKEEAGKQLIEEEARASESHQSPWKQYRSDVYQCVDAVIDSLKNGDITQPSAVQKPTGVTDEVWTRFQDSVITQSCPWVAEGCSDLCVVIDDNMYYHSMRHRYFQLARKYTVGFCQIHIHCDIGEAMARNSKRVLPVSEEVLVTMATKFEVPDMVNNPWEKFSLSLSLADIHLQDIHLLVEQALNNPIMPVDEVDDETQNQSREICSTSYLHQSDQILRRLVSQKMAAAKERNLPKSEMKDYSMKMQMRRKEVLDGLKSGQISVPLSTLSLATDSSKDPDSAVYEFVQSLFLRHHEVTLTVDPR